MNVQRNRSTWLSLGVGLLVLFATGCSLFGGTETPRKVADLPGGTLPLHLTLWNADDDETSLRVIIDGVTVIDGTISPDRDRLLHYVVCITPGVKQLRMEAHEGRTHQEYSSYDFETESWLDVQFNDGQLGGGGVPVTTRPHFAEDLENVQVTPEDLKCPPE